MKNTGSHPKETLDIYDPDYAYLVFISGKPSNFCFKTKRSALDYAVYIVEGNRGWDGQGYKIIIDNDSSRYSYKYRRHLIEDRDRHFNREKFISIHKIEIRN